MAETKRMPTERALIDFFTAQKEQAREEREDLEKYWTDAENAYLNKHDFSKKKEWQAKLFYSITSPTLNRASRMIKNMLLKTEDYFEMDYIGPEDMPLAQAFKPAVRFYLNDADFPERFAEACMSSFNYAIGILGMSARVSNRTVIVNGQKRTRKLSKLNIETCNPWHCFWPKDWGFFIKDSWLTLPRLLQNAEAGIYDEEDKPGSGLKKLKKIMGADYRLETPGGDSKTQEDERLMRLGIKDHVNEFRKQVLLSYYWGPIIDKKGNITDENQRFIVVNEKYILAKPDLNPFAHQNLPYVFINPLKVLFRHFGEGLSWGVAPIQKELTNMLNLMSDSLKFKMAGIIEMNQDLLINKDKPLELYPGCTVRRRGDPRQKALEHHELGADPEWAAGFVALLRGIYENHTGVTEFLQASPTLKGSPTATEVATKTGVGQGYFESIAEDIDRQGIVGAAEMAKDLVIQYFADMGAHPSVKEVFVEEGSLIESLSDEQKEELLLGDWNIKARGLSLWFERKEQINKLARHNDFLKAIPPEIALTQVDWRAIGEAWAEAVWGDKNKFWKWSEMEQQEQPGVLPTVGGELPPIEEEAPLVSPRLPYGGMQ
ncbi:MAG: hypothetical protein BV459_03810 [Thermoplasmata archaeon M11B2D]|nr:MAG: hypothetical protein BV459_03810 [Thermoplasmata archaeon M11B2D]